MSVNEQTSRSHAQPKIKGKQRRSRRSIEAAGHAAPVDVQPTATLHATIEQAAYFRAAARGFEPGHELEDWLAAEIETVEQLRQRTAAATREQPER